MSWQLWDPPAIVIPAPPQAEVQIPQAQAQQDITAEQHFRAVYDKPWNTLQPDGRINMGNESSASVSPYSEHFRSQVEDGIWPLVKTLYNKGYLPVSSCAGHRGGWLDELDVLWTYRSEPYVTIVVHRDLETEIRNHLLGRAVPGTRITVRHSQANMTASTTRIKHATRTDTQQEYYALNWMLQRNYEAYSYITVRINAWRRFSPLHYVRTQCEHELIAEQAHRLQDLPHYSL